MPEKDLNTTDGAPSGAPQFIPSRYMWLSVYDLSGSSLSCEKTPPASHTLCTPFKRTAPQACHCEPARTLVWQSASPQAARLHRPGRGAVLAGTTDRPHGRCNAAHCLVYGLPRRCATPNHHVFYTAIIERPPIVILRRSRRISCTGVSVSDPFCARSFACGSG